MITVKFYGLLRLESGIKELPLEAKNLKALGQELAARGIDPKGCKILVNGEPARRFMKFKDGDTIQLLPPVAGG